MKPVISPVVQSILPGKTPKSVKSQSLNTTLRLKEASLPRHMTPTEVEPPAHIWDRIASALDEQDRKKTLPKKLGKVLTARI